MPAGHKSGLSCKIKLDIKDHVAFDLSVSHRYRGIITEYIKGYPTNNCCQQLCLLLALPQHFLAPLYRIYVIVPNI